MSERPQAGKHVAKETAATTGRPFLRTVRMDGFGAFSGKVIGPFAPGLNVVFGRNEAGKSTVASFVGGVLFGWEDARGKRNPYKPAAGERSGALLFGRQGDGTDAADDLELFRGRNAEGVLGATELVGDIDKATFGTMFSLTSDELRDLRNTSDVTAKLLTAGSGTGTGPAQALAFVQQRLRNCLSRSADFPDSVFNLKSRADELKAAIARASDQATHLKASEHELHDLEPQRQAMTERLRVANGDIEFLTSSVAQVEHLDEEAGKREEDVRTASAEEGRLREQLREKVRCARRFDGLAQAGGERTVRDRIERLAAEEAKRSHGVDLARGQYLASKAAYGALEESFRTRGTQGPSRRARAAQTALTIIMPIVFLLVGAALFMNGHEGSLLSMVATGVVSMAFAAVFAVAALVLLFRPSSSGPSFQERLDDARWVMLQDEKKLQACEADLAQLSQEIRDYLDGAGLQEARGSLSQARMLLEEFDQVREQRAGLEQRLRAVALQRATAEEGLRRSQEVREQLFAGAERRAEGLAERTADGLRTALARKTQQRDALQEQSGQLDQRYGRLSQELAVGLGQVQLDQLKLEYEQVRTRQKEAAQNYARLLLAERMLQAAISAWESTSQPEIYRKASELFSLMTCGKWVKVSLGDDGQLLATNSGHVTRPPQLLSLGTCQQLYLALRIALLMSARNVGAAIPVLADDILVNFDEKRRAGAAAALAELASVRQVVVFTCHKDVVKALRQAAPDLQEVDL